MCRASERRQDAVEPAAGTAAAVHVGRYTIDDLLDGRQDLFPRHSWIARLETACENLSQGSFLVFAEHRRRPPQSSNRLVPCCEKARLLASHRASQEVVERGILAHDCRQLRFDNPVEGLEELGHGFPFLHGRVGHARRARGFGRRSEEGQHGGGHGQKLAVGDTWVACLEAACDDVRRVILELGFVLVEASLVQICDSHVEDTLQTSVLALFGLSREKGLGA
mmetsp:Transcript_14105/g.38627  ORF Transcript_14105/g.38627 Transcript_14105/m.38627 type:complete len:223 (-) Transcript_14105:704-1372(-)